MCFPSGSPGPSLPERTAELKEQFEDLPETEISFVSACVPTPAARKMLAGSLVHPIKIGFNSTSPCKWVETQVVLCVQKARHAKD